MEVTEQGGHGLNWHGATPVSDRFGDPFFSLDGGLDETRHVFLAGNDLPARLAPGFHIAETGFGTGLNLLALAQSAPPVPLRFTSFEAFPLSPAEMQAAHAAMPTDLSPQSKALLDAWAQGLRQFTLGTIAVTIIEGDARQTLPAWGDRADAWFLDGFSPALNPEMWELPLLSAIAAHTAPGGTFATYTAAGFVRRGLTAAGFTVTRAPGFGRKRHMSRGVRT